MTSRLLRPLVGLMSIVLVACAFVVAANLFRGGFTDSVPVTVISERAGLVMNPDAKVQIRGVQVGKVDSIEAAAQRRGRHSPGDGSVAAECDTRQRARRHRVDDGVRRQVRPIRHPAGPVAGIAARRPGARRPARDGRDQHRLRATHIGAVDDRARQAQRDARRHRIGASTGRGEKIGQMLSDLDSYLAKLEPSLPALSHDLEVAPRRAAGVRRRRA